MISSPVAGWTLAIDFGTSNTSASWRDAAGNVREVRLGTASNLMPSVVFAGPDKLLVGEIAARSAQTDPGAFEPAPKRRLGEGMVWLAGHNLPATTLVTAVLSEVLRRAVRVAGSDPDRVVLTHPDRWDAGLQELLVRAAVDAGIPAARIQLLSEARAATWFYTGVDAAPVAGERIAVFDFGAGTCDVAVLQVQQDGSFSLLAADGVDGLGGRDLDGRIWQWVRRLLATSYPAIAAELDTPAGMRGRLMLMDRIREAKETLSELSSASIVVPGRSGDAVLTLTRGEFEELIAGDVAEAVRLTQRVLAQTGPPGRLYLTGGSSLIPLVHAELGRIAPVAELGDPQTVVSQGALRAPMAGSFPPPMPVLGPSVGQSWAAPQPAPVPLAPLASPPQPSAQLSTAPSSAAQPKRGRGRLIAAAALVVVAVAAGSVWGISQWGSADESGSGEGATAAAGGGGIGGAADRSPAGGSGVTLTEIPTSGAISAWGGYGTEPAVIPAILSGKKVVNISAGTFHSMAIDEDGAVHSWGVDDLAEWPIPETFAGYNFVDVAAGQLHSLAVTDSGVVYGWGDDEDGQASIPPELYGKKIVEVSAGGYHSLALDEDGVVYGWGSDVGGQASPPAALAGERIVGISAGSFYSLAVTEGGVVHAWGDGLNGRTTIPLELTGKKVIAVSGSWENSMALTDDGVVYAWGSDEFGQSTVPAELRGKKVVAISAGHNFSAVLTDDGVVHAWGENAVEQATVPAKLAGKKAIEISAGGIHSLAIVAD